MLYNALMGGEAKTPTSDQVVANLKQLAADRKEDEMMEAEE